MLINNQFSYNEKKNIYKNPAFKQKVLNNNSEEQKTNTKPDNKYIRIHNKINKEFKITVITLVASGIYNFILARCKPQLEKIPGHKILENIGHIGICASLLNMFLLACLDAFNTSMAVIYFYNKDAEVNDNKKN